MQPIWDLVYAVVLLLASPWLVWQSIRTGKYRAGWSQKLWGSAPHRPGERPCVWFHAVSVGEVQLLRSLVEMTRRQRPGWEIVISTTTRAGLAVARQRYDDCRVFYCPLDFSWAVRRALRRVRPAVLVLAELELWPNLIQIASSQGIRVAVVNGRLSDRSFRGYARIRPLVSRVLRRLDLIAAQDGETAARFVALGAPAERVFATGSLKFDGAQLDRQNPTTLRLRQQVQLAEGEPVLLAGSTQSGEEAIVLAALVRLLPEFPSLRLVLVPRHSERFAEVASLLARSGLAWSRRTAWSAESATVSSAASSTLPETAGPRRADWQVLLVDCVGELSAWWGTAQIGFVGGSLGSRGGQNMLEPAAFGVATCFGPNTRNFRDIVRLLLAADAARVVEHGDALGDFVRRCLREPAWAQSLGERARRVVTENQGATARTFDRLVGWLEPAHQLALPGRSAPSRAA